jgi:hypothetical protein
VLTGEQRSRWIEEAGFPQLTQILFWRWDPIGVADDLPYTEGEYDEYARELAAKLVDGLDRDGIARYLGKVAREEIGAGQEEATNAAVAETVESWFAKSVERWLEFDA